MLNGRVGRTGLLATHMLLDVDLPFCPETVIEWECIMNCLKTREGFVRVVIKDLFLHILTRNKLLLRRRCSWLYHLITIMIIINQCTLLDNFCSFIDPLRIKFIMIITWSRLFANQVCREGRAQMELQRRNADCIRIRSLEFIPVNLIKFTCVSRKKVFKTCHEWFLETIHRNHSSADHRVR